MMRRLLDALYTAAAGLAALSLLGIFLVMMAQVLLRELRMQLPAADDVSAYLCVATTFFALAATFKRGELIRVGMVIDRLRPFPRRVMEALVLVMAAVIMAYVTWWTGQDMLFSLEIEEVAQGTVPIPLWIPKLAMPLGAGLLLVAILDELVTVLRGAKPSYVVAAEERAASGDFSAEL
ncbi:TRAP transporter small permease [Siccirubricoccus sp. G192]|uniref:TRAP transporter small permease n=1 Tax=Siccirubricoccus sp. G192 TaxID=2849651 RepID=UPI001C2BF462|nr:TRAP transporter small permease [Siccirubricoccus sp. G192]MBV1795577.1 TRAP transporter small permease [Siccirubricoccus sp. G192]MBV1800253.1 TRAP transporter small permease [Siccirubricoccus sp. G192]